MSVFVVRVCRILYGEELKNTKIASKQTRVLRFPFLSMYTVAEKFGLENGPNCIFVELIDLKVINFFH